MGPHHALVRRKATDSLPRAPSSQLRKQPTKAPQTVPGCLRPAAGWDLLARRPAGTLECFKSPNKTICPFGACFVSHKTPPDSCHLCTEGLCRCESQMPLPSELSDPDRLRGTPPLPPPHSLWPVSRCGGRPHRHTCPHGAHGKLHLRESGGAAGWDVGWWRGKLLG